MHLACQSFCDRQRQEKYWAEGVCSGAIGPGIGGVWSGLHSRQACSFPRGGHVCLFAAFAFVLYRRDGCRFMCCASIRYDDLTIVCPGVRRVDVPSEVLAVSYADESEGVAAVPPRPPRVNQWLDSNFFAVIKLVHFPMIHGPIEQMPSACVVLRVALDRSECISSAA